MSTFFISPGKIILQIQSFSIFYIQLNIRMMRLPADPACDHICGFT
jgi:hypothetical protein